MRVVFGILLYSAQFCAVLRRILRGFSAVVTLEGDFGREVIVGHLQIMFAGNVLAVAQKGTYDVGEKAGIC